MSKNMVHEPSIPGPDPEKYHRSMIPDDKNMKTLTSSLEVPSKIYFYETLKLFKTAVYIIIIVINRGNN